MEIREDDLAGDEIARFLRAHLDNMYDITPPESVHALDLDALRAPDVTFWSAWDGDILVGCAALKELDQRRAEIKSMRTAESHRGRGVGSGILEHLLEVARGRDYDILFLETGAMVEFEAARSLYRRYGFEYCGPFAGYRDDPNSVFMTLLLQDP
ncbi:MAG: GNAT family N-acetyltransferase [Gammaproteobacteria bacterium]